MKTDNAVNAIKARLRELDAQSAGIVQAYEGYQADRNALQRTLELLAKAAPKHAPRTRPSPTAAEPTTPPQEAGKADATKHVEYGGLIGAVREFAKTTKGKFSTKHAERFLKNQHPDLHAKLKPGALAGTFFKLREAGVIKLVEKGSGRRPSTYVSP